MQEFTPLDVRFHDYTEFKKECQFKRKKCKVDGLLIRLIQMKKKIPLILIIIVMLAACTANGGTMVATETSAPATLLPTATNQPTPTLARNTSSPQTLVFWHPWTGTKAASITALVEEYNASNPDGVTVQVVSAGDDDYLISKVEDAITNDNVPDVLAAPSLYLRSLYADEGALAELDTFINDAESGISVEEQKTIPAVFLNLDVLDGVRYAFPADYELHFLFYNQTWAKELGFENAPTTSEQFLNQACAAASYNASDADDDNNGTGGWIYNTNAVTILSWMQVFGGGEIPEEARRGFSFNTEENQDALEFLRTIYQLDCAWTGKEADPYRYFAKRYALFYSGSSADWYRQIAMDRIQGNEDEWMVIAYPGNDGSPVVNAEVTSYGIFQSNPEKEQMAWNFVHWLVSSEAQTHLVEETYSMPVNLNLAQDLTVFLKENPEWQRLLTYLPLAKPTPHVDGWNLMQDMLQDAGWQLSLYTVKEADIPTILENMETMMNERLNDDQG